VSDEAGVPDGYAPVETVGNIQFHLTGKAFAALVEKLGGVIVAVTGVVVELNSVAPDAMKYEASLNESA